MCSKYILTINMTSQVVLVIIVLALSCSISAENAEKKIKTEDVAEEKRIHHMDNVQLSITKRPIKSAIKYSTKVSRPTTVSTTIHRRPVGKLNLKLNKSSTTPSYKLSSYHTALSQDKSHKKVKDRPRKHKKKMDRALMALLLAYKLKFAALIPTMIMGFLLLLGTTALAGFFFALFAAILGLKAH